MQNKKQFDKVECPACHNGYNKEYVVCSYCNGSCVVKFTDNKCSAE